MKLLPMKSQSVIPVVLVLLNFAAALSPSGAAFAATPSEAPLFDDPVIARGKGVLVRRSELDDAFVAYKANMAGRQQAIPESQRAAREAQLLDRLIVTQLLINRSSDADRAKARESAAYFLAESKKNSTSDEMFARQLKAMGLTPEQFNVRVMEQAMAEAVLEREVKSQIKVTDPQVQDLYDTGTDLLVKSFEAELTRMRRDPAVSVDDIERLKMRIQQVREDNLDRLQEPERVRISHIFLATRDRDTELEVSPEKKQTKRRLIEKLLEQARGGADFQQLIDVYSEDRNLKETRGQYTFGRGARFAPEFKAAAFSLAPGQLSDVVSTPFGYHILKLQEKLPARKIPLSECGDDIRKFLVEQEMQKRMPDYFSQLKKEAGVEILDPRYHVAIPKDLEPLPPGS